MLDEILKTKKQEIEAAKKRLPMHELKERLSGRGHARVFRAALSKSGGPALIAELKRKSPSRGMLRQDFDPVILAEALEKAGASAFSVLTDEFYFGGGLELLRQVKQSTSLPVLRKDFIVDPYQVYESAFFGADAVLLIARILPKEQLEECMKIARGVGVEPFIEVRSESEIKKAAALEAGVIGINARDLDTFEIDLGAVEELITKVPAGITIVAESGIQKAEDVERFKALGVNALLIGEALMSAPDVAVKVEELFRGAW